MTNLEKYVNEIRTILDSAEFICELRKIAAKHGGKDKYTCTTETDCEICGRNVLAWLSRDADGKVSFWEAEMAAHTVEHFCRQKGSDRPCAGCGFNVNGGGCRFETAPEGWFDD